MDISRKDLQKLEQAAKALKKKQSKFDKIHNKIQRSDPSRRAYEYTKEQAKLTCNIINTVQSSGFKKLENLMVEALLNKVNAHDLYITTNEYGNIIVDYERLQTLILKD